MTKSPHFDPSVRDTADGATILGEIALHGTVRRSPVFVGQRRVSLLNRGLGKSIDILMAVGLYFFGTRLSNGVGPVLAFAYLAFKDGFGNGQSLGKKITGVVVVEDSLGLPASLKDSFIRNFPFCLSALFLGSALAQIVFILLLVPWILLEAGLVYFLPSGVRLGDVLANTYVDELRDEIGGIPENEPEKDDADLVKSTRG